MSRWLPVVLRVATALAAAVFVARASAWLPSALGPQPRGPEWFWPPEVALAAAFALTGMLGAWAARPARGDATVNTADPPQERRPAGPDLLAAAGLLLAGVAVQRAWIAFANPTSVLMGVDHISFGDNVVAWLRGDWRAYNTDKPVMYAALSGLLTRASGDPARAAVLVSVASGAVLPVLAWAAARPLFGRVAALAAGLCALADAETWVYTAHATNTSLFAAISLATLAAWSLALRTRSFLPLIVAGALAGLSLETSEKAFLTMIPVFAGVTLVDLTRFRWRAALRAALTLGVAVGAVALVHPPVAYTPLGNLIGNKRAEVNLIDPWTWPAVKHPDPAHPYPYADLVPTALRRPAWDVTLSVLLTPNDSNVLRLQPVGERKLVEVPGTSMPPQSRNVARNVYELSRAWPMLPVRLAVLGVAALGIVLLRPRAASLLFAFAAVWGALAVRYEDRYVVHLLPIAWVVSAGGLGAIARALAGRSRVGAWIGSAVVAGVVTLLALATAQEDPRSWAHPTRGAWPPPSARLEGTASDIDHDGASARALADWLRRSPPATTPHDCSPVAVRDYLPATWPVTVLDPWCARLAEAPAGTLVIAAPSMHPDATSPTTLLQAGWTAVAAAVGGRVHTSEANGTADAPASFARTHGAVLLLRR